MKSLEDRIASLELQLLSHGIPCVDPMATDATPDTSSIGTGPISHGINDQAHDLVAQIALDSLQDNSFSRRISNQSSVSLLQSPLLGPMICALGSERKSDYHSLLNDLPYETRTRMSPRETARRPADAYFEHCDLFSPLIASKEAFLSMIELLYREHDAIQQTTLVTAKFRVLLVFATTVLLLNRTDSPVPVSRSEGYYAAAIRVPSQNPDMICTGDLDHVLNILLAVQYSCFSANLAAAAWHFISLVTRLAIELNLQNEPVLGIQLAGVDTNERRWLF
ncbi:transcription factor [Ophiostoma piceae UAMH 11346]|uniref:Transcription factor n=1 Tax=Ophiostoma piceae (strain UAMH 11346) TaxID=1262450 RepID=S3BUF5_OPHP1|nr:transcription factor [Ophiostoma piceae UAMH 11346]